MEYRACELVLSIQEFLKIVPGIVIFPFSFYLAWKKIGVNVSASFTVQSNRTTATRISEVVLANLKDKPITIFEIYAVIDKKIYWVIEKLNPPIILKPLESTIIETKPYTELSLGGKKFEPNFIAPSKIEIYIATPHKMVKCNTLFHPNLLTIPKFKNYQSATKSTKHFNNIVYNDEAVYAIIYILKSETKTAIVDRSGIIDSDFSFGFNMLPPNCMKSKDTLIACLENTSFGKIVDKFYVHVLE